MLFTVGYSSFFEVEKLINKLKDNNISILIDIRTFPYSNAFPQYNKENLEKVFHYKFLGDYVGGLKIKNRVKEGINSLKDLLTDEKIKKGINYLYKLSKNENIAIMCAEKSPFDCHRFLAVASLLHLYTDLEVKNIIEDKLFSFEETINWWKEKENLKSLNLNTERLLIQRLNKLYKIDNKREEKFPSKIETLKLFN
ncbi:DUF488 domain-containing protein [Hydrogenothermus marinus]|uniref:Uncharacterized protein DUF488 n=1 Tax=Hydrogenothermus marinus TaxID=133270 RepID=A0A3M0BKI8_9AQUI|nr:DUF488 domain-containing protein [Hydrogenothermus marinus]RMA97637.1 uncharacterized protein DUF488 [Hydrogenothermus marinus]